MVIFITNRFVFFLILFFQNLFFLIVQNLEFNRSTEEDKLIPQSLENFLEHVAKTGTYM